MDFAEQTAQHEHGEVFTHSTRYMVQDASNNVSQLATFPQGEFTVNPYPSSSKHRPEKMAVPGATAWPEPESSARENPANAEPFHSDFDPLLGFDAYYFEI